MGGSAGNRGMTSGCTGKRDTLWRLTKFKALRGEKASRTMKLRGGKNKTTANGKKTSLGATGGWKWHQIRFFPGQTTSIPVGPGKS